MTVYNFSQVSSDAVIQTRSAGVSIEVVSVMCLISQSEENFANFGVKGYELLVKYFYDVL